MKKPLVFLDADVLFAGVTAPTEHGCRYLLTFNIRHYEPATSAIVIQPPGDFLTTIRTLLVQLEAETEKM